MPPKAPPAKKAAAGKSRSPSPPSKGGAKKPAGSAQVAPKGTKEQVAKTGGSGGGGGSSASPLSTETATALLQALGRAFLARCAEGIQHKKWLAKKMEKESEDKIFANSRLEKKRREKQRQLANDAAAKAQQRLKLIEALSVASFEGTMKDIKRLVESDGADLHAKDSQGNYAIGEAAVNGQVDAISYLLDRGADPNARGEYDRTPMWRAAFNSHTDAIRLLLERGGDPRLRAQGQAPDELCGAEGKAIIAAWDLSKTDAILAKYQQLANERDAKRKEEAQAVAATLSSTAEDIKSRLETKQKELVHHKQAFEQRILEYDIVCHDPGKAPELVKVALDCVKAAEADVQATAEQVQTLQEEYFAARTTMALHNHEELGDDLGGTEFPFKRLADVVFEDTDNLWKSSGKWPVIFDPSAKARTFLKYRNVIFVDTFLPTQMEPDALRRSVLGALRYGKPLVLDLRDVPMLSLLEDKFNQVYPNLFEDIVSKKFQDKDVLVKLIKQPQDGPELVEEKFSSVMCQAAKVIVVSSSVGVDDAFGNRFIMLRVEDA